MRRHGIEASEQEKSHKATCECECCEIKQPIHRRCPFLTIKEQMEAQNDDKDIQIVYFHKITDNLRFEVSILFVLWESMALLHVFIQLWANFN